MRWFLSSLTRNSDSFISATKEAKLACNDLFVMLKARTNKRQNAMNKKTDLKVIEGQRDDLENQISHALFTVFDDKALESKLSEINSKLEPKGKLKLVSDESQTLQDER